MQKITIFALVGAVALVAAALVGVGFAQITTPTPTAAPINQNVAPWCINGNPEVTAPYCYNNGTYQAGYCNNATGTPVYCVNGTVAGYCAGPQAQNGYNYGAQGCHGYGAQGTQQGWFGGMMGGRGIHARGW